MAVKRTGQMSLAEALLGGKIAGSTSLDRLGGLVKWYRFEKLLGPLRDGGAGRPAWPPLVLYRALLLQSLYGLSDRELEEALADRLSFRRFAGLGLEESVPDHTVLYARRHADRGGIGAALGRKALARSRRPSGGPPGQARLHLRLQGPCRGRRGLRPVR